MRDPLETAELACLVSFVTGAALFTLALFWWALRDAWRHWWAKGWDRAVRMVRGLLLRGGYRG